jgi:hypothetical protein
MFLSAKGLLGHVTKLRRSSGRIKPQPAWYLTMRERELNTWGVGAVGSVRKERKNLYDRQIWRKRRRVNLGSPSDFATSEKLDAKV